MDWANYIKEINELKSSFRECHEIMNSKTDGEIILSSESLCYPTNYPTLNDYFRSSDFCSGIVIDDDLEIDLRAGNKKIFLTLARSAAGGNNLNFELEPIFITRKLVNVNILSFDNHDLVLDKDYIDSKGKEIVSNDRKYHSIENKENTELHYINSEEDLKIPNEVIKSVKTVRILKFPYPIAVQALVFTETRVKIVKNNDYLFDNLHSSFCENEIKNIVLPPMQSRLSIVSHYLKGVEKKTIVDYYRGDGVHHIIGINRSFVLLDFFTTSVVIKANIFLSSMGFIGTRPFTISKIPLKNGKSKEILEIIVDVQTRWRKRQYIINEISGIMIHQFGELWNYIISDYLIYYPIFMKCKAGKASC